MAIGISRANYFVGGLPYLSAYLLPFQDNRYGDSRDDVLASSRNSRRLQQELSQQE
jgi:hypothetical protein